MKAYTIALFFHIVALMALFGGLVLVQNLGARLRRATTWEDARMLLAVLQPIRGMFAFANILLLATGLYMAQRQWGFETPWVAIATASVVVFGVVGVFVGRRLAMLGKEAASRQGFIPDAMRASIRNPVMWSAIFAMNFGVIGIIWLMTNKPGWIGSIVVTVVLTLLGALVGPVVAGAGAPRGAAGTSAVGPVAHRVPPS